MAGPSSGFAPWADGLCAISSQDIAAIPWTAGEIEELEHIFDESQSSSATTSPPMPAFAATPIDIPFVYAAQMPFSRVSTTTTSSATTPSTSSTPPQSSSSLDPERKRKREREKNTEAARRYRKRRVDEADELRGSLAAMTRERDEMRLQLVKAQTEVELLRKMNSCKQ